VVQQSHDPLFSQCRCMMLSAALHSASCTAGEKKSHGALCSAAKHVEHIGRFWSNSALVSTFRYTPVISKTTASCAGGAGPSLNNRPFPLRWGRWCMVAGDLSHIKHVAVSWVTYTVKYPVWQSNACTAPRKLTNAQSFCVRERLAS